MPTFVIENRYIRKDGQTVWVRKSCSAIFDADGLLQWMLVMVEDIQEGYKARQALRQSERIYRAIGESTPYGVWITDGQGKGTYASQSLLDLLGVTLEQFAELGWAGILHPDDAARVGPAWQEFIGTSGNWDAEFRIRGKDGQYHPVWGRGVPVRDDTGQIIAWAGINLDLSNLRKAEEQLRNSQRIYRAIGESIPFGIWINDADGRNRYASQSLLDMIGFTQEQFSDFGLGEALDPDDAQRIFSAWQEYRRDPGERVWSMEHRFRGKDGHYHWVLGRGVPIRDDDGKLIAWAGINLDIDELKRTQADLLLSRQRFESVLRNSPLTFSTQDRDLHYTWVYNPMLGVREQAVIGQTEADIHDPQEVAELVAWKRSVLESGAGQRREFTFTDPQGTLRTFDVTTEPLRDASGQITGITSCGWSCIAVCSISASRSVWPSPATCTMAPSRRSPRSTWTWT
jgi:PAS domain S-box-containing protein